MRILDALRDSKWAIIRKPIVAIPYAQDRKEMGLRMP